MQKLFELHHVDSHRYQDSAYETQRKACFVMFRIDLNILLTVTIVEVQTLNLDICVSLHYPIQKFLHNLMFKILKPDKISCRCVLGLL